MISIKKKLKPVYAEKLGTGNFVGGPQLHKFQCTNCGEYVECYGPPPKRNDCPNGMDGRHAWLDIPVFDSQE